jgi:hypothetical protein
MSFHSNRSVSTPRNPIEPMAQPIALDELDARWQRAGEQLRSTDPGLYRLIVTAFRAGNVGELVRAEDARTARVARVMSTLDRWADVDGGNPTQHSPAHAMAEKLIATAFEVEHVAPYAAARVAVETILLAAPDAALTAAESIADDELVCVADYEHERHCVREVARLLDIDEGHAERIVADNRNIPNEVFAKTHPGETARQIAEEREGEATQPAWRAQLAEICSSLDERSDAGLRTVDAIEAAMGAVKWGSLDLDVVGRIITLLFQPSAVCSDEDDEERRQAIADAITACDVDGSDATESTHA